MFIDFGKKVDIYINFNGVVPTKSKTEVHLLNIYQIMGPKRSKCLNLLLYDDDNDRCCLQAFPELSVVKKSLQSINIFFSARQPTEVQDLPTDWWLQVKFSAFSDSRPTSHFRWNIWSACRVPQPELPLQINSYPNSSGCSVGSDCIH